MKERPILFNGPMVRALLDGSKTQTRRIIKRQPSEHHWQVLPGYELKTTGPLLLDSMKMGVRFHHTIPQNREWESDAWVPCPYGRPGDHLRVKEAAWMWCEIQPNGKTATGRPKVRYVPMREAPVHYHADHPQKPRTSIVSPDTGNPWGWRMKIGRFLPAWASRITLEVTGVRVERLQDISEPEAIAEGVYPDCGCRQDDDVAGFYRIGPVYGDSYPIARYAALWESINGPGSWDANPWVWCVSFLRVT